MGVCSSSLQLGHLRLRHPARQAQCSQDCSVAAWATQPWVSRAAGTLSPCCTCWTHKGRECTSSLMLNYNLSTSQLSHPQMCILPSFKCLQGQGPWMVQAPWIAPSPQTLSPTQALAPRAFSLSHAWAPDPAPHSLLPVPASSSPLRSCGHPLQVGYAVRSPSIHAHARSAAYSIRQSCETTQYGYGRLKRADSG